jgi:hypothetical protein
VPEFVPGRELSWRLYKDVVAPQLKGVPHAAGLLGPGSDVLGFDTAQSTDHDWGPRLQIFVEDEGRAGPIDRPATYAGWRVLAVDITTPRRFFMATLGFDPADGVSAIDWLTSPTQTLRSLTDGAVHHDEPGQLTARLSTLRWYPRDIRLYVMAAQWRRIAQEEHLLGRTAQIGDSVGTRILTARLVRDLIRLAFLQEQVHAPYAKWFGTALANLELPPELLQSLDRASEAEPQHAADALARAYELLAERHNALGLTEPVDPTARPFFDRPFRVIQGDRLVDVCRDAIRDDSIRELPLIGSIDQWVDSTDMLGHNVDLCRSLAVVYGSDQDLTGVLSVYGAHQH